MALPAIASAAVGMQSCAQIRDDQRRLACYDQISGRAPAIAPLATAKPVESDTAARKPMQVSASDAKQADFSEAALTASEQSASMLERA